MNTSDYIDTQMSRYIHLSKYSRWRPRLKRRETWEETCDRLIDFWKGRHLDVLGEDVFVELRQALVSLEAVPSMRCLMTAGEALSRDNVAAFNCCSTGVSHIRVFDEIFYLLMNGCGVGFSVENKYISKLPVIAEKHYPTDTVISVRDSKIGWAKGLKELIALLFNGDIPTWDLTKVRPAGTRLKTFGGRACLTGDTILYKDRKKTRGYNEITIKHLFDMENSQGFFKGKANHFKDVKLRSLDEESGIFFRNKVITVIDNGLAPVYEVVTENGYRIKATGNHRFMFETGDYKYLDDFTVGSLIAVNGSKERKTGTCIDCGCEVSRRALRCKSCYDTEQLKDDALDTTARQRKQNRDYVSNTCEYCGVSGRIEVHHIDKNPRNNEHDNLECLCPSCHQHLHAVERTFSDPYSHKYLSFDRIISIEYAGEDRVYDLQMEAPNHNFIANGFVSHNSGPDPLNKLFDKTVQIITGAAGRRLNSLEIHDLICWIAMTVIVGSVRRSACISMSDLKDDLIRRAKQGEWYYAEPQRALSNNSAMYDGQPNLEDFMKEFGSMYKSRAGERGVINKQALRRKAEGCGRVHDGDYVVNPCVEAILRDTGGLCNLSESVIRKSDTYEDIARKVRIATIFGTLQSTLVDFRYLRKIWRSNQEEERLLGVSLTGIMDHPIMRGDDGLVTLQGVLMDLKEVARETNKKYADLLGIPHSKQLCLIKPSGTVSQLCGTASGIHPRYAKFYLRRVTQDNKDPLTDLMIEQGVPHKRSEEKTYFSFPVKAPEGSICGKDIGPIQQLELWKVYQEFWCDGNPSQTIYYTDDNFLDVQAWVYNHFDIVGGLSFFPYDDFIYDRDTQPYLPITEEEYEEALKNFPEEISWDMSGREDDDNTTGMQEYACSGGKCDIS